MGSGKRGGGILNSESGKIGREIVFFFFIKNSNQIVNNDHTVLGL